MAWTQGICLGRGDSSAWHGGLAEGSRESFGYQGTLGLGLAQAQTGIEHLPRAFLGQGPVLGTLFVLFHTSLWT